MVRTQQFYALDGLRGVAAIIVVLYHLELTRSQKSLTFSSGYLAVDLFFMLSGFVIGYAYERRLLSDLSFYRFVEIRLIRLYPLYILGCFITLLGLAIHIMQTHELWLAKDAMWEIIPALLLFPKVSDTPTHWFVLNPPAWSLFYEILFNFLYAFFIPKLTTKKIIACCLLSLLIVGGYGLNFGGLDAGASSWVLGPFRATLGLGVGIIFYRLWASGRLLVIKSLLILPPIMFIGVSLLPSSGQLAGVWVLISLTMVIPVIIVMAVNQGAVGWTVPFLSFLGNLSYPIYALHWPIMGLCRGLLGGRVTNPQIVDAITVFATLLISALALTTFDHPIRNWLGNRLRLRRTLITAAPPL